MSNMACIYCSKPVGANKPMDCCLNCQWLHTVRNHALNEFFFYEEEEDALVKKLKEVKEKKKRAKEEYERIWELTEHYCFNQ